MHTTRALAWSVAAVAVAAATCGCAPAADRQAAVAPLSPAKKTAPGVSAGDLEAIPWTVAAMPGPDGKLTGAPEGVAITATFDAGKVKGFSGINSYEASYVVQGARLTVGPRVTMSSKVGPAETARIEKRFLETFVGCASYRSDGDSLELLDGAGTPVLAFHVTGE